MKVSIVGAYNTRFGSFVKRDKESGEQEDLNSFYELLVEAGAGAISDAGLEPADIEASTNGQKGGEGYVIDKDVKLVNRAGFTAANMRQER